MFLLKAFSNLHTNSQQFFMHEIFLKINLKILENLFWSNILFALTPLKLPSNRNVVEWYIQIVTKTAKFRRFLKVNVTISNNSAANVSGRGRKRWRRQSCLQTMTGNLLFTKIPIKCFFNVKPSLWSNDSNSMLNLFLNTSGMCKKSLAFGHW